MPDTGTFIANCTGETFDVFLEGGRGGGGGERITINGVVQENRVEGDLEGRIRGPYKVSFAVSEYPNPAPGRDKVRRHRDGKGGTVQSITNRDMFLVTVVVQ